MTSIVTEVRRRTFGLPRLIYAIRCPDCGWRTEVQHLHLAFVISRDHTCPEKENKHGNH